MKNEFQPEKEIRDGRLLQDRVASVGKVLGQIRLQSVNVSQQITRIDKHVAENLLQLAEDEGASRPSR